MEADFIRWLRNRVAGHPRLTVGLGSDAAVIANSASTGWVVTTDAITEGVDFRLAVDDPRRIGRKALAVNLSDLAAMAARPVAVVVNLVLPRHGAATLARELYEGLLPLAEQFEVAIAGGDTNTWDGGLVVAVTAMGETTPRGAWTRAGARPGDEILVTGSFGGSFLGKQFDFTPRVATALRLNELYEIHAATDVSDGLALDLSHILEESGCGAELDLASIPLAPAAAEWARACGDGRSPLEHALSDGEDFELILAAPPDVAARLLAEARSSDSNTSGSDRPPVTRIGRIIAERGLFAVGDDGGRRPLVPRGYQHIDCTPRKPTTMPQWEFHAADLADTDRLGAALADIVPGGTVIGLVGTLGAGKTRLVQAIATACGVPRAAVSSPTFVLCHEYQGSRLIYHLDAYRLSSPEQFRQLGPEEMFAAPALTIIEWADRVAQCLPSDYWEIEIRIAPDDGRDFMIRVGDATMPRLDELRTRLHQSQFEK